MRKNDAVKFLIFMRNGFSFCFSWFVIIILVYSIIFDVESIKTKTLFMLLIFILGAVFIFGFVFTRCFIKRWSFIKRLNSFFIIISVYQFAWFYKNGIFNKTEIKKSVAIFFVIALLLYIVCMFIYSKHSKKKEKLYTMALKEYQKGRRDYIEQ